jgi:hypothetical protein
VTPHERKATVMSQARAKELPARRSGDRGACQLCNPRPARVPMDRLWAWSLVHPGESPFRSPASGELLEDPGESLAMVVAPCRCGPAGGTA